jgi:hypothetical protein
MGCTLRKIRSVSSFGYKEPGLSLFVRAVTVFLRLPLTEAQDQERHGKPKNQDAPQR